MSISYPRVLHTHTQPQPCPRSLPNSVQRPCSLPSMASFCVVLVSPQGYRPLSAVWNHLIALSRAHEQSHRLTERIFEQPRESSCSLVTEKLPHDDLICKEIKKTRLHSFALGEVAPQRLVNTSFACCLRCVSSSLWGTFSWGSEGPFGFYCLPCSPRGYFPKPSTVSIPAAATLSQAASPPFQKTTGMFTPLPASPPRQPKWAF